MIVATEAGALGDYNHYRSVALQSTVTRAISILTTDVNSYVRNLDGGYFATIGYRDGDLGENILVDGVDFTYFQVGIQYRFSSSSSSSSVGNPTTEDVVVEITEKIEPCMNLCKLSYIKSEGRCKYLIEALAEEDGLRGWYAKVIQGGIIRVGDSLSTAITMA
jgi:MOSC domain-containing protein YiiM